MGRERTFPLISASKKVSQEGAVLKVYEPLTLSAQSAKGLKDASAWAASVTGLIRSKLFGWQSRGSVEESWRISNYSHL